MPNTLTAESSTHCQGCGVETATVTTEGHCLDCERAYITADIHSAEAALEVIEGAVRAALGRTLVHPDDVLMRVGQAIREEAAEAKPLDDLRHASRRNMDARARAHGNDR